MATDEDGSNTVLGEAAALSEGVADEDGGESDDAAAEDHVASVRAWLEREGVVRNGGLLDVTTALLGSILEDHDGDGFAWLLQALPSARQRARLGRSILRLHRVLQQRAPLGATPHVMRDGVWAARSGVPLMVSLAELQMQAQVPTLEQAELPAESIVALRDVSDRLCALHHSVRWGRGRGEEGREGAARDESARLLARISWARARCEELLGSSEGSIGHLAECRALLKAAAPPAPLRAVPLLQGPRRPTRLTSRASKRRRAARHKGAFCRRRRVCCGACTLLACRARARSGRASFD